MKMDLIKTSNGRLRFDPDVIIAIEQPETDPGTGGGEIYLVSGQTIFASNEEISEIITQWEAYCEGDDDDEGDGEGDDDEESEEFKLPGETISLVTGHEIKVVNPGAIVPKRRTKQS